MLVPRMSSSASRIALIYITLGALLDVWSATWYFWLNETQPEQRGSYFVCAGVMLSGLTLLIIGLAVGRIGRSAAPADVHPAEATATLKPEQNPANGPAAAVPTGVPVQGVPVAPTALTTQRVGNHPAPDVVPVGGNPTVPPARKA